MPEIRLSDQAEAAAAAAAVVAEEEGVERVSMMLELEAHQFPVLSGAVQARCEVWQGVEEEVHRSAAVLQVEEVHHSAVVWQGEEVHHSAEVWQGVVVELLRSAEEDEEEVRGVQEV